MDPYDISQIFIQMERDLIISMKRNLARHLAEEAKEGFEWEQWQRRKLQALASYRTKNKKIINTAGAIIDLETKTLLQSSFRQGGRNVDGAIARLWRKLQHLFIAQKITKPITKVDGSDDNFFKVNEKRVNALIKAATQDLQKGRYAMLRQADDVYRQTIYKSQLYLNAGATSLSQAIDMATNDFLDKGFNCIIYKDGRRVNIASYAELALRASSQRAVFMGEGARREEWGIHTVVVSSHKNCSPLCLPWQGKAYIDDVYSGGKKGEANYPLLSTAIRGGLFHPHCRHNTGTYFEGISSLPEPVDNKKASANYDAEQRQRYMERQIRKYKRHEVGDVDPKNKAEAAAKVKEWQGKIREHLADNPQLRRDPKREQIKGGFSPKQRNEALKKVAEDARIEEIRKHIRSDEQPKNIYRGLQLKHIQGTNGYKQEQERYAKIGQYGPSKINLSLEELQELIGKYAGAGDIKFNNKGEWNKKETILTNDTVIGKVVNNKTSVEAETTVFKIHYGKKGAHIVPDYPSKKGGIKN